MKALIRNKGETVTEEMKVPGINWNNGYPLTSQGWVGGCYLLVTDYDPDDKPSSMKVPQYKPEIKNEDDYVVIDGKRYSKAELRSLIE